MTISKPHLSNPNKKKKITKSFSPKKKKKKNPILKPTKTWTNIGGGERSVAFPVWFVTCGSYRGRGSRSLDVWHTNLDSNPNPNRSTNSNSLFHGCGAPKLVFVAPDQSFQWGTSSSAGEEKLEIPRQLFSWHWFEEREQDDSFAVVGKREERAYERERR